MLASEPGEKEAILVGGSFSTLVDHSAQLLQKKGFNIVDNIELDTGNRHWGLAVIDGGKTLIAHEKKNQRFVQIPGFK